MNSIDLTKIPVIDYPKRKGITLDELANHVWDLTNVVKSNLWKTITSVNTSLTSADLQAALTAGVTNVLAGVGADYRLDANVANAYVAFREKDANHLASVGAYAGTLRTGLIVDANGIAMGYNRKSDGNWITSITLDGTTGNVSLLGTLTAGSIITSSVTLSTGNALSTIDTRAANGQTVYQSINTNASTLLKGQLRPDTTGALATGTITWNTTTGVLTGGTGIAITSAGIIGANAGVATFTLDATTGSAFFGGNIVTAGQAVFSGSYSSGLGLASVNVNPSGTTIGIIINKGSNVGVGLFSSANIGTAIDGQTNTGIAVAGFANSAAGYAGYFVAAAGAIGVFTTAGAGGIALQVSGAMTIDNSILVTNLNADKLDGLDSTAFSPASHSQAFTTITGRNTSLLTIDSNIPLGSYKMTKTQVIGDLIDIYDPITHAFVATYEWALR